MPDTTFKINTTDECFIARSNSIFDHIDKIENNLKDDAYMDVDDQHVEQNTDLEAMYYKGQRSMFKVPLAPISRCLPSRGQPDYKINPHKWKKYSLRDVELTTDRGNSVAALNFLSELQKHKGDEGTTSKKRSGDKITFRKVEDVCRDEDECKKSEFRRSKVIMPEYVVGEKSRKRRKTVGKCTESVSAPIVLDHLLEEESEWMLCCSKSMFLY